MKLKAGTLTNQNLNEFSNSMASAMMHAMEKEYEAVKNVELPSIGREDMKIMFSAIAQGVIRHLRDNPDAFKISGADTTETIQIETQGTLH
jgi:hypothetical protein